MKASKILSLLLGINSGVLLTDHTALASSRWEPFNFEQERERAFSSSSSSFSFSFAEQIRIAEQHRAETHAHFSAIFQSGITLDSLRRPDSMGSSFPTAAFANVASSVSRVDPIKHVNSYHVIKPVDLKAIEEDLKSRGIKDPERVIATYAAAVASQKFQQDFFGFDIRDQGAKAGFQKHLEALTNQGFKNNLLLKDWIHQPNSAIRLAGFLNSFGYTLTLADAQVVGSTLSPIQSVNPARLLDKAYTDMTRLISGQVVAIDEQRCATKEEEKVLIQAALNLGRKKTAELDILKLEPGFRERLVESFVQDYNLRDLTSLTKTTRRHNAILLSLSLFEALGMNIGARDDDLEHLLKRSGFTTEMVEAANAYRQYAYQTFSFLQPSHPIEEIISGRLKVYANTSPEPPSPPKPKESLVKGLAVQTLQGIETLGIDPVFVYEKLTPYGKPAFEALKTPGQFVRSIWKESKVYPLSDVRKQSFKSMLHEMERALIDPSTIHEIHGFGYGSVAKEGKTEADERRHELLTKRTWLSSCHDFIVAYYYAKTHDCLAEFYADATPPENAPCLPGKIRSAQEWFESKNMLVDDTAGVLEKVFAGMAGIELSSAVQQLYRKYVWAYLEIYRAEKGGISAEEAKKQEEFKKEYLTLKAIKEGLVDMVAANLPSVIRKYRSNHSIVFPIAAFHSYKYGNITLQDGLGAGDLGITNVQDILQRQSQANKALLKQVRTLVDVLSEKGVIEVYSPFGLMSLGEEDLPT
ncbi:hypothetical protein [Candidatus Finniella inopinata]|uniref:Uncharacterized protein n=1 Tax=Candidatus Finniella inopinata TaxID=1696036 RepID=A0A4Q7DFG0_9PROT|nr:hypothetical protein [Candidatus Finniella inopinata]RZI45443.1 hypothetical protein EQU50_07075 [Candidatus Finniella inopinata]